MKVHPTAMIAEGVELGADVEIGPHAIVEEGARIGRACQLAAYAIVREDSVLGQEVKVDSFAVVGGEPQMAGFDPITRSHVEIGDGTILREGVTVHRSKEEQGVTRVGAHCFFMSQSHVGHDCQVEDHVTLGNNVLLAGHVSIGTHTFVGGAAAAHQFCRIGEGAMVGGLTAIMADIPPFTLVARRNRIHGLNLVGLRRRNYSREEIRDLKDCLYRIFQSQAGSPHELAKMALESEEFGQTAPGKRFLEFIIESKRGYARPANRE